MRLGSPQRVLRRAVLPQDLGDQLAAVVSDAGGELAVGIGSGAALAELDVAILIQRAAGEKGVYRPVPLFHFRAPLQHHRPIAPSGQNQRGKHPRGAEAHDHGRRAQTLFPAGCGQNRSFSQADGGIVFHPDKRRLIPRQFKLHRADGMKSAVPQVKGLPVDPARGRGFPAQTASAPGGKQGFLFSEGKRKPDVRNQDTHGSGGVSTGAEGLRAASSASAGICATISTPG